jgi:hypothetical protein
MQAMQKNREPQNGRLKSNKRSPLQKKEVRVRETDNIERNSRKRMACKATKKETRKTTKSNP